MPAAASIDLPPRYRDARHVATGGMAAVYAAQDTVLGRRVAIKVLGAHMAEDPDAVRRFQREARAAAKLSHHPHVVTVYDVDEHDGRPFIVMELREGGSLAGVLRAGPPPRADALRWVAEAASALDAAHEQDIVHRDVKPGNLLLDDRRRLGVADFGIARIAYETSVTMTGQVLGTAAYVAPEQAAGHGATAASDRYSLAVVAYELLTGERPFPGGTFAAQARRHVEEDPTPPSALDPDLRAAVDGVLLRAMAKDPAARWETAGEFADALARAAGEEPTAITAPLDPATAPTRPVAAGAGAAGSPVAAGAGAARSPVAERARRARPWLPAALVAIVVGLIAVIALAAGGGGREAARPAGETAAPAPAERPATPPEEPRTGGAGGGADGDETVSIATLNDRGFALMNRGRHAEALAPLREAVRRCGDSRETVCAYALFNLGRSLRLAGHPAEAIPILERRLAYDNQTEVVRAELEAARREAGAAPGAGAGDEDDGDGDGGRGNGRGKGEGKGKDKDKDDG